MHDVAGGVVATWRRNGYLVDGGIHFLMGHRSGTPINAIYKELGIDQTDLYPTMTTYIRFTDEPTGFSIDISNDLEAAKQALMARFSDDRRTIEEIFRGAQKIRRSGGLYEMGLEKAPELMSLGDRLGSMWKARKMVKFMMGRYARPMTEVVREVKDAGLKRLILNLFSPQAPEWLVMSVLAMVEDGQIGLISDGCTGFMRPMVERYQALGGVFHFRSRVVKIVVDGGKAVGVRLEDGSEHKGDIVISAADGRSTIYGMLEGRYVDERIEERYRAWNPGASLATVSLGLDRTFQGEPPLQVLVLGEPLTSYGSPIGIASLRILNYGTVFAPPGKTLVQVLFEGDWEYWCEMSKDRKAYDASKASLAWDALRIVESQYTGVSGSAEVVDVSTPYTYWRYTGNDHGSIMGWSPPTDQMLKTMPRTLPGLDNFYMVGQWSMPGGSVPTCIASGRQAVQVLCRKDKKVFSLRGAVNPPE